MKAVNFGVGSLAHDSYSDRVLFVNASDSNDIEGLHEVAYNQKSCKKDRDFHTRYPRVTNLQLCLDSFSLLQVFFDESL